MTLYARFAADLNAALDALEGEGVLVRGLDRRGITVEPPRDVSHGDLSTNAAMVLAKGAGTNPRALAALLVPKLEMIADVAEVSVAGPGFINLRLTDECWRGELVTIDALKADYGKSTVGAGIRVNVEYVSANPTGPMHMGHCRGAVVGDALASVLQFTGHSVTREYYVNDAGGQVDTLARSVHLRYREALGEDIGEIPQGLYPGDYLVPVGKKLADVFGESYQYSDESQWLEPFKLAAVQAMMALIRKDLKLLGIVHDKFTYESEIHRERLPEAAELKLREHGLVYDGTLDAPKGEIDPDWEPVTLPLFRSTEFGDDQDRPIKKSDGTWTYFGADMAYHYKKAQSADKLIDIWGADHAGTVKRIRAAVAALTENKTPFDVKLVQMVRLMNNGDPLKMSKRSGNFITIDNAIEKVESSHYLQKIAVDQVKKIQDRELVKHKFGRLFKHAEKFIKKIGENNNNNLNNIDDYFRFIKKLPTLFESFAKGVSHIGETVNAYGKDVVRFTMLTRKADAQMDFDFAKVVEASKDNPVFYVQYAHARICSLKRKVEEAGIAGDADPALLDSEDLALIKFAAQFPRIVEAAAANHEPHRIAFFLYDLAASFHAHWNMGNDRPDRRILVVNNAPLTLSRLLLATAIGQVIANGLSIMGVTAAEEM